MLSSENKEARLKWALKYASYGASWDDVIWSDEKKFNLDGLKNFWWDSRTPKPRFMKRHSGGGSLMVWACFNKHGKSELLILKGKQNSGDYQKTLKRGLIPFMQLFGDEKSIFQQDNCPIHVSQSSKKWCSQAEVRI